MADVRMKGFKERIDVETALKLFFEKAELKKLESEEVSLWDAYGRVLAEDVVAEEDIPHFNRSAVDGYAVRSMDTFGASSTNPILLRVVGEVEIGEKPSVKVGKGEAVRVATGAPLPEGSDAVIMIEYTSKIDDITVEIYKAATPGGNVSGRGEDVRAGELILRKGTILQPQDVGMLAALGKTRVKVVRKPRVAVLSTGNELVEPGTKPDVGQIVDVNRFTIASAVKETGGEVVDLGISRDDASELESKLKEGLASADMVIVSGGTSVGARDLLPEVVNRMGEVIVHGVSMKPGMPTALAVVDRKPVILLPGFPVAALLAFYTFVPRIMQRMMGIEVVRQKWNVVKAKVTRRIPSSAGVRTFTRVIVRELDGEYVAEPLRTSGSGVLSSMIKANGLIVIPEDKEGVEEGEEFEVILIRPILRC